MTKMGTGRHKWEGTYADSETYSGHKSVHWTDEDNTPVVAKQPVPRFNAIKQKYFYRYLSPAFMKEHKNTIKLYNTLVQELMRQ